MMSYDPAVDIGLPQALADGLTTPTAPIIGTVPFHYNGTTIELTRGTVEGTALASAARTATTYSSDITNYNARGVIITWDITVSSGNNLTLRIQYKDALSGKYEYIHANWGAVAATGTHTFALYPGIATAEGDIVQKASMALPRVWRIEIIHGSANSNTYSVGYCYLV